ncbi:hypothetical protein [Propioniciclava coleopterorum]|uniref:hypothetical protein n=1 Tax=Propioniciclava coleopterorum TaxID=2714937 RepID=UPI001981EF30|nr:hypothetical protein [Propioniciclava coleopterorum]
MSEEDEVRRRQRWRLALGSEAEQRLGALTGSAAGMEEALAFLEGREGSPTAPAR